VKSVRTGADAPFAECSHSRASIDGMNAVFQHITVPVDGSTTSQRGIAFALELARDGGRISFCSVVDPTLAYAPIGFGASLDMAPMLDVLDGDAALFCRRAQEEAAKQGTACDVQVLHGPCIDAIESFAAHNGSDAVVIGTNARRGMARVLLGSIAEGVLRRAQIPVVAVHEDDTMRTGALAVAVDSSPAAHAALDVALGIAAARGMAVLLVHVSRPGSDPTGMRAVLEQAKEHARTHGVVADVVVHEGTPADQLLQTAEANDCCMLVMGTHGRAPLAQMVLGSVAAAIVERARIPVVTVRCAA
jgi:nucleotide-binding universal stress UspA family protein